MIGITIKNLEELRERGYDFKELGDGLSMEIYQGEKKIFEISRVDNGYFKVKDVNGEIMLFSQSVQVFMQHTKTQSICVMPG